MHSAASEQETSSWLMSDGLKELELLLRAVLSHQSEPIVISDDDRCSVDASSGACKLLGLSSDKLIGRSHRRSGVGGQAFRPRNERSAAWASCLGAER